MKHKKFDSIPKNYYPFREIVKQLEDFGSYRNIIFYKEQEILPEPIRVKGYKEVFYDYRLVYKRWKSVKFLKHVFNLTLREIATFIKVHKYPEEIIKKVQENFAMLLKNDIFSLFDIRCLFWVDAVRKYLYRVDREIDVHMYILNYIPIFLYINATEFDFSTAWYRAKTEAEADKAYNTFLMLSAKKYKEIRKDLDQNSSKEKSHDSIKIEDAVKEMSISFFPPRKIKLRGHNKRGDISERILNITRKEKMALL